MLVMVAMRAVFCDSKDWQTAAVIVTAATETEAVATTATTLTTTAIATVLATSVDMSKIDEHFDLTLS